MKNLNVRTIKNNKGIILNVIASFGIKGAGMIVNMLSVTLYIDYFNDNTILGLWFTILSVLNWILSFDIGIGNGLRNRLTTALANDDYEEGKRLTSSALASISVVALLLAAILISIEPLVNWNRVFNIPLNIISSNVLSQCVVITIIGIIISFSLQIVKGILYALQVPSLVNFLDLLTSCLLVLYLFVSPCYETIETRLKAISIGYAILINIPLLLSLVFVFFFSKMRYCRPGIKYITSDAIKAVLGLGLSFFVAQLMYMIITVTNEWFISYFFNPAFCVEYQIYYRLFALVGSLIMLALSPLWSAITKAYAQNNFKWIIRLQVVLNYLALVGIVLECVFVVFLQPIIDVWLGANSIRVDYLTASFFLLYGVVMIWVAIQSTIVAGLGNLKTQLRFYAFAALFKIVVIMYVSQYTDNWSIVVFVTGLALLPYCIYQPREVKRLLLELEKDM